MSKLDVFIHEIPFLSGLNMQQMQQILPLFKERSYKKGHIIFHENDQGYELFIIKSGCVKICQMNESKEMILAIFREGDYFGEMALIEENPLRSATAEAMEASVLYVLQQKDLLRLLEMNPSITIKLLQEALGRIRHANGLLKDLTTLDSRSRIIKMVLHLADKYGKAHHGRLWIDQRLTHQQLAEMTGTVRETVTKTLLELQNEKYIQIKQKHILIENREMLCQKLKSLHGS